MTRGKKKLVFFCYTITLALSFSQYSCGRSLPKQCLMRGYVPHAIGGCVKCTKFIWDYKQSAGLLTPTVSSLSLRWTQALLQTNYSLSAFVGTLKIINVASVCQYFSGKSIRKYSKISEKQQVIMKPRLKGHWCKSSSAKLGFMNKVYHPCSNKCLLTRKNWKGNEYHCPTYFYTLQFVASPYWIVKPD